MAPLYQRYIPPKKHVITAAVAQISPAQKDAIGESQSPPSRQEQKKKKHAEAAAVVSSAEVDSVQLQVESRVSRDPVKVNVGKKEKTKRKRDAPQSEVESNGPALHPDRAALLENGKQSPDSSTKRRRVEGRSSGSGVAESSVEQEAAGILRKHGGLLSKFQKSMQKSASLKDSHHEEEQGPERVLHDLVPIPQPDREATPEYKQTFSTLPDWVANPISVSSSYKVPFRTLGIDADTTLTLETLGFQEAFPVQAALIPRLLSRVNDRYAPVNDLCIGAPTGSGKTLAYCLPVALSLKKVFHDTKLRALIIVPTRELVQQVSITLSSLTGRKVGVSVGHQNFSEEQANLVERRPRHDPLIYDGLMKRIGKRQKFELDTDEEAELDGMDTADDYIRDCLEMAPYFVPSYSSKVDVLVCTPGRVVEHLKNTVGFNLDDLEWLIIDEADQLLDQSFQNWVEDINAALDRPSTPNQVRDIPDCILSAPPRYVRKVILSATMTRDVNHLNALRLRRPSMIVVKSDSTTEEVRLGDALEERRGDFELPSMLTEAVVPIGDGGDKPLYLISVLESILTAKTNINGKAEPPTAIALRDTSDLSSATSSSDGSSSDSSSSSDESSDSSSDSSDDSAPDDSDSSSITNTSSTTRQKARPTAEAQDASAASRKILIFAASTAEAHRLTHLVTSLVQGITCVALTRDHKLPKDFMVDAEKTQIIVSTDLAGRGLDLPLTHVINYTIPRSLESYVHRIGRTARAGRTGDAYSLVADKEAAWFWNEIARNTKVKRGKVERRRVEIPEAWMSGTGRLKYEQVLAEMSAMVDVEKNAKGKRKEKSKKTDQQTS